MEGYALRDGDCDDADSSRSPSAVDWHLDGIDQDCDGVDACAGATRVAAGASLDCAAGLLVAEGSLTELPDGGCLCAVEGDLSVSEDNVASDWDALEIVEGELLGPLDSAPPSLRYVGELTIDKPSDAIDLSTLKGAKVLWVIGDVDLVDLSGLATVATLVFSLEYGSSDVELLSLETADNITIKRTRHTSRLVMPSLREVGEFWAWESPPIEELDLGVGARFGALNINGALLESFVLPEAEVAGLGFDKLTCLYTPANPKALFVGGDGQAVLLPDLESAEDLSFGDIDAFAPKLRSATDLDLAWYASLYAMQLDTVSELLLRSSTLTSLPLGELDTLVGTNSTAPSVHTVGTLEFDGTLSDLTSVTSLIEPSSPIMPKLTTLEVPVTIERMSTGALPALESSAETLYVIEGSALFPSLKSAPMIHVDNVHALEIPQDATLNRLRIDNGKDALALPDPVTFGVIMNNHRPSAISYGVFEKGLSYTSNNYDSTALIEVDEVQGNVQIEATVWLAPRLVVYTIGGDLDYCIPYVPEADRDTWLASMAVAGTVTNTCP